MERAEEKGKTNRKRSGTEKKEDNERELLRRLIRKGVLDIKPSTNGEGLHYDEAEETWKNANVNEVKQILAKLERQGALQSRLVEHILTCPDCGSPDLHSKYTCPRCSSDNVEHTEVIEHLKCGHIGPKTGFTRDSSLFCPNCQTELTDDVVQYRTIGNFYQCEKCGYRFDKPEIVHKCQHCGKTSNYQEAKYIKVLSYRVTEGTIKEFERDLPVLDNIKKILSERGFTVKSKAKIKGSSGVESSFDLLAEKDDARIVIDISTTGSKNDIVALLAKKIDIQPTRAILIDMTDSEESSNLGKVFDIPVLKAISDRALQHDLEALLPAQDTKEDPTPRRGMTS